VECTAKSAHVEVENVATIIERLPHGRKGKKEKREEK
jgi:hypothetical protein